MRIKTLNYNTQSLSCQRQITLSNIDEICPLAIPNQTSLISMHVLSLVKIPWHLLKLSSGNKNMGMSQADNSIKIWQNLPISNPKPISTISMHIPSLVKIHWCLLKLSSVNGNKNMGMSRQITLSKFYEICRLAIPNQISTISMHIPNLVKIHWCLLKLSSGNEIRMDGLTTDWRIDALTRGRSWGYSFDLSLIIFNPTTTIFIYLSTSQHSF